MLVFIALMLVDASDGVVRSQRYFSAIKVAIESTEAVTDQAFAVLRF
jgi:DICT domain-containing protein